LQAPNRWILRRSTQAPAEAVDEIKKQATAIRRKRNRKIKEDIQTVRARLRAELEQEIRDTNKAKVRSLENELANSIKERTNLVRFGQSNCLHNRNCQVGKILHELDPNSASFTTDGLDESAGTMRQRYSSELRKSS